MEVKAGYKQTEVGIIPEDWDVSSLGEVATFKTGPFGSALHQSDYTEGGIPVVNPMQIVKGKIVPSETMTVPPQICRNLSEFLLKKNDIVIGRRGEMGRCAIVSDQNKGWLCGTGSMIIRTIKMDSNFLFRVLSTPRIARDLEMSSIGTTMANLNQNVLQAIKISSPAQISEQRAIATALSDVDALIASLDALIAKKRDIKQATMQDLLTGRKRLPGFHKNWIRCALGDLVSLSRRSVLPYMQPSSIFLHFSLPAYDNGQTAVVEFGSDIESNKYIVPNGSVLLSKLNPRIPRVWAPSLIPSNAICSTEFLVLCPIDVDRDFLYQLCLSSDFCCQMQLHAIGTTGSHQRVTPKQALEISCFVPSDREEQSAISTFLSDRLC